MMVVQGYVFNALYIVTICNYRTPIWDKVDQNWLELYTAIWGKV